ncbi:hypothetical protein M3Y94_00155200 [Aphelenchoides besseyi]|nr:hypothetical protein M3Y94_00155200 [Aphelenchoides besseyi]KAI6237126.1 hypothetical protein M3Y95_00232200 [Aphelenchoides besseyi]
MNQEHSRSECQKHNTPESLWIVFDGKDVSAVLRQVPAHRFSWSFIIEKLNECKIGTLKRI